MKIRNGFVSNSSSSSFVIAKTFLTEKQIDEMEALYTKLREDDKISDDNGCNFSINKYYVSYNAYNACDEWHDFIDNLNLPEGARFNTQD